MWLALSPKEQWKKKIAAQEAAWAQVVAQERSAKLSRAATPNAWELAKKHVEVQAKVAQEVSQ